MLSELDLHCGTIESQVLRQDGRRDGHGALGRLEPAGGTESDTGTTEVESVPDGAKTVDVREAEGELDDSE